EVDATIVFDDVFVPWEQVFVYRSVDLVNAQFHESPSHTLANFQSLVRFTVKLEFMAGLALKLLEVHAASSKPEAQASLGGDIAALCATFDALVQAAERNPLILQGVARPHPQYVYAGMSLQRRLIVDMLRAIASLAGAPSSQCRRRRRSSAARGTAPIPGSSRPGAPGAARTHAARADVVIDCRGTTVIPGLVDSHCHVVLGDYTPRQKTVDFLDSYVHGGITSVVSAGEGVHAPGRPHDPAASKALAIAAAKCFEHFHPNGMKVNAGSVVLEPGLTDEDFAEMARHGVRHAKYGFGGYAHPRDGEPEVRR